VNVDVHAHLFPTAYLDELERLGKPDVPESRMQLAAGSTPDELRRRVAMMDAADVDMQVLSPAGQLPYFERVEDGVAAARLWNDLAAECVSAMPERLRAFGAVPLPHVDAALAELDRTLDQLGMVGITIGTSVLGRSIVEPEFEPLYEELDRRRAILYVHPSGLGAESPLIAPYKLTWVVGAPVEDTIAVAHLVMAAIPHRYPNIQIIVSHMGGAMALLLGRMDFLYRNELPELPELPSVAARKMWYDTVAHGDVVALRCAYEAVGPSQLVLGSDYPYQLDGDYARCVSFIRDAGIAEEETDLILSGNMRALVATAGGQSEAQPG
jgi:6-methylsalicylate decarboxylase